MDPSSLIRASSPVGVGNDWQYFGWSASFSSLSLSLSHSLSLSSFQHNFLFLSFSSSFENSETGLTPFQRQGETYFLSTNLTIPATGTPTTIIGYGVVEFDKPEEWNQAQKVSFGPFSHARQDSTIWSIHYTVDTTGGDSGSAIEQNGYAVGVHTHGGCSRVGGGVNSGTFIGHPALQRALQNPRGICA
jgi:hypothetical protein